MVVVTKLGSTGAAKKVRKLGILREAMENEPVFSLLKIFLLSVVHIVEKVI